MKNVTAPVAAPASANDESKIRFRVDDQVLNPDQAVKISIHGKVVAMIYPDDSNEVGIAIDSQSFAHGGHPSRAVAYREHPVPSIVITFKQK